MRKMVFLLSIIFILVLSACSGNTEGNNSGESKQNEGSETSTGLEEATLRFAIWDENQRPAMDAIAERFMEDNPHIEVQVEVSPFDQYWTKLETSATGKSAPDIFWLATTYFLKYADNGIIEPLDSWIERDQYNMDNIYEGMKEMYTHNGSLYAVPKDYDNVGLWYNRQMFDDAGLDYPDDTWDWDTLVEVAKKLTKPDEGVWGFAAALDDRFSYYNTIVQFGGQVITDDFKSGFDSPEALEAIKTFTDMIHVHKISPSLAQMADTGARNLFKTGKVAMVIEGSWRATEFAQDPYMSENADVAVLPKDQNRASSAHSIGYVMYADSENKEQTWEFMKFLGSREAAEIQADFGAVIPAYEGTEQAWVDALPQFNLDVFIEMASYAAPVPVSYETNKWRSEAEKMLQPAWIGEISVEEVNQQIADYMNQVLEEEGK